MEIDDFFRNRIVVKRVKREIPPCRIVFVRAEFVIPQNATMFVGMFAIGGRHGTEGRGLDDFVAEHHVHQAEATTNDARATK